MVFKIGKYGTRSGHTVEGMNKRFVQRYRRSAYLIWSNLGHSDDVRFRTSGALCENESLPENVELTLNKRRRWEIPEVLKDLILNHETLEDIGIQLILRHRICRSANCVSVYATDGLLKNGRINKERQFKVKDQGGFFQSNSVLKTKLWISKREYRKWRRRRENGENEEPDEETAVIERPQIRYEVHVPTPQTSFLAYSAMEKRDTVSLKKQFDHRGRLYRDMQKNNHRKEIISEMYDEFNIMNDNESFSDKEEECVDDDGVDEVREKGYAISLEDLIVHTNRAARVLRQKWPLSNGCDISVTSKCNTNNKKGHIVILNNMQKDPVHEGAREKTAAVKLTDVDTLHVSVVLKNEETVPKKMTQMFGNDYVEGSCFPRKFVLNISNRVSSCPTFRNSEGFFNAFLVFIQDTEKEINNINETVYKLHINADFRRGIKSLKIETIFDNIETNIEEIIERTLFYIETLPVDSVNMETTRSDFKTFQKTSTLEECNKWVSQSYRPNNQTVLKWLIKETTNFEEAEKDGFDVLNYFDEIFKDDATDVSTLTDRFCSVCFELLCSERSGTALMSCHHWFCDSCWLLHLSTQIELGALDLGCPEYGCDRKVDVGTLISLVNLRDVIRYARKRHNTHIEQNELMKWCPNSTCGRVIMVNSVDNKLSKCACGGRYCFDCLRLFHWPASCSDFKEYIQKMKINGDIYVLPSDHVTAFIANGKYCPNCHQFVERKVGCGFTVCVCHVAFCWGCGKSWDGNVHDTDCHTYSLRGYNTKKIKVAEYPTEVRKRHGWYKVAIKHHINQHPTRKSRMNRALKVLTKSVQGELGRRIQAGQRVVVEGQEVELGNSFSVSQTLLRNTLDMYVEVNNIVENTSVLLNVGCIADKERLKLRCISRRLSAFADVIYELFMNYSERNAEVGALLDRLLKVREHVRRCVQSVSTTVKTL
ncbi:uncharacterized protein LOC127880009 [Dreissena polymorpha]|uniref:RBR-type E3 ubiquitin transferase n=1 Tax=Dreissena polymorpha TaxID=45954 RepID=A0A9D4K0R2_DREPO|nr:uncharacterized protein LOC127880009 [Dreissena polymorpha]KAH3830134.1 hypothetical protein DPMN_103372 [Dreissena polymorpha]